MADWYWIRHGPTHAKTFLGWTDLPADLSDTKTLNSLDAYLPDDAVVVSSDLQRSITTADAIQGNRERRTHENHLREFHFGEWEGRTWSEVAKADPDLSMRYWDDPGEAAPAGGESWNAVSARVTGAVDKLVSETGEQPVVAVAHIGVILTQVQRAAGISAKGAIAHQIDNLSLTHLRVENGVWRVVEINRLF